MIKGMTGFGSVQFSKGDIKGIVEIKSLNHKYFDISYYLPIGFGSLENKIRQTIIKKIKRGKVTISVKIIQKPPSIFKFNKDAVKQYLKYSKTIQKEFRIKNDVSLSDLIKLPGVVDVKEIIVSPDAIWGSIDKNIKSCLSSLLQMRSREGKSLAKDVRDKLNRMVKQVNKIKSRAKVVISQKKKKLNDEEYSSYLKSNDINEEVSRLSHYIDEIKILINSSIPVGKKMDFIAQEMQRETNTIGSKMQDKIVSNSVIALKSKIEKIREQSQNIE